MNRILRHSLAALLSCSGLLCVAQQAERDFPRFTITPGRTDANGLPTSGAKLCIFPEKTICYIMPSHKENANLTYDFGAEPLAQRLSAPGGGSWVFFSSLFSGGGSGTLRRLAVLRYEGDRMTNLLPYQAVTNVSEYAMWSLPQVSPYPVLVKADFIWAEGETHFEPHRFQMSGFDFDPHTQTYRQAFAYETSKKYDGGDSRPVRVLQPERSRILSEFAREQQRH